MHKDLKAGVERVTRGTLGGGFQAEGTASAKVLRQEHDRYVCRMVRR